MTTLAQKKEAILQQEQIFASAIGETVFEKPKVSFWMVLIPILFLYFIYRMQKFKLGRMKFCEEFMITRRRALDAALNASAANRAPDVDEAAQNAGLRESLQEPYRRWVRTLVDHYMDLLAANGGDFESLVREAYGNRTNYLLILNRLNTAERDFYAALRPHMDAAAGATDIIAAIELRSRSFRHERAEQIFP